MIKCKITVLKCTFNKELVDQYVENERRKTLGPCEVFHEGQEFLVDPWAGLPQDFCPWAWDDIYKASLPSVRTATSVSGRRVAKPSWPAARMPPAR